MNLQAEIRSELWDAIYKQYESELYSNAIVEAIHYLSNVLRERANVDGDGVNLVGQALAGDTPRLRINKFQTPTEKDEQKGLEQLLRGIYVGIRNPRSHEQSHDSKSNANSIILFIDYILGIIGQAKQPYSIDEWIKRVFDPSFVKSKRYAELLVSEVPPQKLPEALIRIYIEKESGNLENSLYVFRRLFELIEDNQLDDFLKIVSDELKTIQSEKSIIGVLKIIPENLWPRLDEIARLRIENRLVQSIKVGKYDPENQNTNSAFGTWPSVSIIVRQLLPII